MFDDVVLNFVFIGHYKNMKHSCHVNFNIVYTCMHHWTIIIPGRYMHAPLNHLIPGVASQRWQDREKSNEGWHQIRSRCRRLWYRWRGQFFRGQRRGCLSRQKHCGLVQVTRAPALRSTLAPLQCVWLFLHVRSNLLCVCTLFVCIRKFAHMDMTHKLLHMGI